MIVADVALRESSGLVTVCRICGGDLAPQQARPPQQIGVALSLTAMSIYMGQTSGQWREDRIPGVCDGCLDPMSNSVKLSALAQRRLVVIDRVGEYDDFAISAFSGGRAGREVLPMNTNGRRVMPGQTVQIVARPQRTAFRPERIFISAAGTLNGAGDWIVEDVMIGNRSQLATAGGIPGDMFASGAVDSFLSFETCQTAMDLTIVVRYVGANEDGCALYASVIGISADAAQSAHHLLLRIDGVVFDFVSDVGGAVRRGVIARPLWPNAPSSNQHGRGSIGAAGGLYVPELVIEYHDVQHTRTIPDRDRYGNVIQGTSLGTTTEMVRERVRVDFALEEIEPIVVSLHMREDGPLWGIGDRHGMTVLEIGEVVTVHRELPRTYEDDYTYYDEDEIEEAFAQRRAATAEPEGPPAPDEHTTRHAICRWHPEGYVSTYELARDAKATADDLAEAEQASSNMEGSAP